LHALVINSVSPIAFRLSSKPLGICRADEVEGRCELHILLPLESPKLLMLDIAEAAAVATLVRCVPGINKVFVVDRVGSDAAAKRSALQADGINFEAAWCHPDVVDTNAVTCNDVAAMLDVYGVEAARATLVREVQQVFGAYGIQVDARHLFLIGDFMTYGGGYRPCNRLGIASNASPLLKMSFETSTAFLKDAALRGACDAVTSTAARIVLGQPVMLGTGAVALCTDISEASN
jgi:DNA-directed RNA polymerase I subunit RPA1